MVGEWWMGGAPQRSLAIRPTVVTSDPANEISPNLTDLPASRLGHQQYQRRDCEGIFYVMGGFTTGTVSFNYSVAVSELSHVRR